jgi:lysophospholipase L1-like esterase
MKMLAAWLLGMACMVGMAEAGDGVAHTGRELQAAMQKQASGQTLSVVFIGGSITTGYAAQPPRERGWAAQVAAGLAQRGSLRVINAGVSGTDSAAAVQRLKAHVLDAEPDLVFVEFGVNDEWLDPQVRVSSYEGLLRQLLLAKKPPAVVAVLLTQQGNQPRTAPLLQQQIAAHYGVLAIDVGAQIQQRVAQGKADWATLYDEPVHPNQRGHDVIASVVLEALQASASGAAPKAVHGLPPALHGRAHEFVHSIAGDELKPWFNRGFVRGGAVHPDWAQLPGGQTPGWTTDADDAEAAFLVWGSEVAVFHAESEHYRNLEAWVDEGPIVTLQGHVPERRGYLGWHYSVVGRGLEPGAHLLHVRVKRDALAGSGRSASLLALMSAGLTPAALRESDFEPRALAPQPAAAGLRWVPGDDAALARVGRFDTQQPGSLGLAWSGSELRARFTGTRLALRLAATLGVSSFNVEIDGHHHWLELKGEQARDWWLREPLSPGVHELRIVKRTEGSMAEARLLGLLLAGDGRMLAPPPARPLRLEFYGDSITAGACNGDLGTDQYEDLFSHDGTRAYGALTAARLGADYVGIAVSGIGITRTWGDLLMPQVWDRVAPRLNAPTAPVDAHAPDVVLVNLGQNDHGFPASLGEPFAADFAERYLGFVRQLRQRYPQAKLVLMIGGMPGWKEQPALLLGLAAAAERLRAEGDHRVWTYTFKVFSWAHPRIDVHVQMADELTAFLREQVLP